MHLNLTGISQLAALFAGTILLLASALKAFSLSEAISSLQSLLRIGPISATIGCFALIGIETVVGASLIFAKNPPVVIAAVLLFAGFALVLFLNMLSGTKAKCGCFGHQVPIRWHFVYRNLGLAVVALLAGAGNVPAPAMSAMVLLVVAIGATSLHSNLFGSRRSVGSALALVAFVILGSGGLLAQTSTGTDLRGAIVRQDVETVAKLLNGKAALARTGSPLLIALDQPSPNYEIVRLLVDKGADVNSRDAKGNTPLLLAVGHNEPKVIRLLVRKGASMDVRDSHGQTPLSKAVYFGHRDVAELLVRLGAKIDQYQAAALGLNGWLLRYLRSHPAALDTPDASGFTVLDWAAMRQQRRTVELVLELHPKLDLFSAAAAGEIQVVRQQLDKQPGLVNARDRHELTPLKWAVLAGQHEVTRLLLQRRADPNLGHPIFPAVHNGDLEMVKILVDAKADTQYLAPGIGTPYTIAVNEGKWEIAELLKPQ